MMTPITISKTMMTRKDLDMGGGKGTKREESSNSTSSYKEAAECVALGIMIVTCLLSMSTMFMVITTKVIMRKKKMETSKATMFMIIATKVIMIKKDGDLQGQAGQSGEDSSNLSSSLHKALDAKTNLKVGHH